MNVKERLLRKTNHDKISGCWLWTGTIDHGGYGRFKADKKMVRAHRFSFQIFNGDIPKGMFVMHKCDNRSCVNPDHLMLGTHEDNMKDMFYKGRNPTRIGENNGRAKLTDADIVAIRRSTLTQAKLAAQYEVSAGLISMIKAGIKWGHISDE